MLSDDPLWGPREHLYRPNIWMRPRQPGQRERFWGGTWWSSRKKPVREREAEGQKKKKRRG